MIKNFIVIIAACFCYYLNLQAQSSDHTDCVDCQNDSKPTVYLNGSNVKELQDDTNKAAEAVSDISDPDFRSFCALMVTETFEDAIKYLESKGFTFKDVYKREGCGHTKTTLLMNVLLDTHVRSFLMLRRTIVKEFGNNEFVDFINTKAPFDGVVEKCPLDAINSKILLNPSNEKLQKLQSYLVDYGAKEDC